MVLIISLILGAGVFDPSITPYVQEHHEESKLRSTGYLCAPDFSIAQVICAPFIFYFYFSFHRAAWGLIQGRHRDTLKGDGNLADPPAARNLVHEPLRRQVAEEEDISILAGRLGATFYMILSVGFLLALSAWYHETGKVYLKSSLMELQSNGEYKELDGVELDWSLANPLRAADKTTGQFAMTGAILSNAVFSFVAIVLLGGFAFGITIHLIVSTFFYGLHFYSAKPVLAPLYADAQHRDTSCRMPLVEGYLISAILIAIVMVFIVAQNQFLHSKMQPDLMTHFIERLKVAVVAVPNTLKLTNGALAAPASLKNDATPSGTAPGGNPSPPLPTIINMIPNGDISSIFAWLGAFLLMAGAYLFSISLSTVFLSHDDVSRLDRTEPPSDSERTSTVQVFINKERRVVTLRMSYKEIFLSAYSTAYAGMGKVSKNRFNLLFIVAIAVVFNELAFLIPLSILWGYLKKWASPLNWLG